MWADFAVVLNTERCVGFSESLGLRSRLLRKIKALKAEQSSSGTPDEFLCPVTRELMKDPVIAAGQTTGSENKQFMFPFCF